MYSTTGAERRSSHGPILRSEGRLASEPFNVLLRTKMKIKILSLSSLIQTSNGAHSQLKTQTRRHHHIKTHPTACPLHPRCDAHI